MSTTAASVVIASRFNGPLHSGQGGHSSGVFAAFVDGSAEVNLRRHVPVDVPLSVERSGGEARVLEGDTLIADVRVAPAWAVDVPAVTIDEARAGAERYRGAGLDLFDRCYVCGREREDSFRVFAGDVPGRSLVASPWTPPAWAAADAVVLDEHVWGALDCPAYFAAYVGEPRGLSYLARMRARIEAPIVPGVEYVVAAWPIRVDGRKRVAASAVLDADGAVLATAEALLVAPRG
jgi:hypothetical protein